MGSAHRRKLAPFARRVIRFEAALSARKALPCLLARARTTLARGRSGQLAPWSPALLCGARSASIPWSSPIAKSRLRATSSPAEPPREENVRLLSFAMFAGRSSLLRQAQPPQNAAAGLRQMQGLPLDRRARQELRRPRSERRGRPEGRRLSRLQLLRSQQEFGHHLGRGHPHGLSEEPAG